MAAELQSIISEYLDQLPADHPDRRYLESLRSGLRAYLDDNEPMPMDDALGVPAGTATTLAALHINLTEQAIEFEDHHGTVGRLRFGGATVLYEGAPLLLQAESRPAPPRAHPAQRPPRDPASARSNETV